MRVVLIVLFLLCFAGAGICGEPTSPAGVFISKADPKQYISFQPDGTFFLKQRPKHFDPMKPFVEITGNYRVNGDEVTLVVTKGGEATGKLKANVFTDADGAEWIKEGTEAKSPFPERPKRPPKWY